VPRPARGAGQVLFYTPLGRGSGSTLGSASFFMRWTEVNTTFRSPAMNANPTSPQYCLAHVGRPLALVVLIASGVQPSLLNAANPKPFTTVLKGIAVLAAGKGAEEATGAMQDHFQNNLAPGESIYSVDFNFKKGVWADYFSRPDIFLVLERTGGAPLLLPDIEYGWDYKTKIYTFKCQTLQPGSKCVLRLFDDDSASDAAWKSILASRVTWNTSASARPGLPIRGLVALEAKATATGEIQLYSKSTAQLLTLDEPDPIATATFTVPTDTPLTRWEMEGSFVKGSEPLGSVHFTHWYSNRLPTILTYLMRPKLAFWVVIFGGSVWLLYTIRRKRS
jgi:hypothetical protein